MPNWCENTLTISGPNEDIAKFIEENHNPKEDNSPKSFLPLDFTKSAPITAGQKENESYNWKAENWGTKTNSNAAIHGQASSLSPREQLETYWLVDDQEAIIDFETAYAPPIPWLETVAAKYPTIYFMLEYREIGSGIEGIAEGKGLDIEDDVWNYIAPEDHSVL